jgi:SAM-dependent methyltransferase
MSLYGTFRRVYVAVLPRRVRTLLYAALPTPLKRLRNGVISTLQRGASHEEVYNADYYAQVIEPTMEASADVIAASIVEQFGAGRVVDIGCGTGLLLAKLRDRGVDVEGVEYSHAAVEACRGRGLKVGRVDLEHDPMPPLRADVVVSTEVAEHLPESCAERFVDALCAISGTVVMTAATPGQGGTDHVNEQPNEYWIKKLAARGYVLEEPLTAAWRRRWEEAGAAGCYWNNVMVFQRAARA